MANTDQYSWPMPTPGGSPGTWGEELNTLFDDHIEEKLKELTDANATAASSAQATADAALPKAGGTMTGTLEAETVHSKELLTQGVGTLTVDTAAADAWHVDPEGDSTIEFTNIPDEDGLVLAIALRISGGGSHTITWPTGIRWDGDTEPTLQSEDIVVVFIQTRSGSSPILRGVHAFTRA